MGVKFKNNAESTLSTTITASDVGLAVAYGDGSLFPAAGSGDYFYLTIEKTDGTYEIVKVTARSGDSMTIVRGQEGTTPVGFSAGSLCELRITNQGLLDKFAEDNIVAGSVTLDKLLDISTSRVLGRKTAGSGDVEQLTASEVLDMLGSTRGMILFRGASGWSVLSPGSAGNLLQSGGAGADPSWLSAVALTDGDKGDITVSASGATWTIDNAVVTFAKIQNLTGQYRLLGRSSSGAGSVQEIASSADVFTILGAANFAAVRSALSLSTMALQASSSVSVTGGTIQGLSTLQGTAKVSTNTSGTLALVDADCVVPMTGDVTLNGGVFSARQMFLFYAGASSRQIIQGTSMTLRLGGSATTGSRTLAAHSLAVGFVVDTNTIVIAGVGVT